MILYLLKNVKSIYKQPYFLQWALAIFLTITAIAVFYTVVDTFNWILLILLVPIVKPIEHFLVVPLLKLIGILNYYSPMLIGIRANREKIEIHNGSSFDYLINMRWKQKGIKARKRIMRYYLKGFLGIIEDIEKKRLPENLTVSGSSYFFSNKTADKIGFTLRDTGKLRKLLFVIDYVNLFFMYSYSNGKFSFPQISKLKLAEITAKNLVQSKKKILTLLRRLNGIDQLTIRPRV